jgi:hypothetical protein
MVSRKDVHLHLHELDRFYCCLTKVPYAAIIPATHHSYVLSETRGRDYEPYVCPYCGDYHIGRVRRRYYELLKTLTLDA